MMNFESFKEYVVAEVNHYVPDEVKGVPELSLVHKPNCTYTGLVLKKEEDENKALPTVHLEAFYELYMDEGMERAMSEMAKVLSMTPPQETPFDKILQSWDTAKEYLAVRVLDYERNKILLEDGPGDAREGLLLIYTLNLQAEDGNGFYSARINNGILEKLGISEEQLKKEALTLASKNQPVELLQLDEMTFITSEGGQLGASALFYPGVLEKLGKEMGSVYLIPSSVHEWIAISEKIKSPEDILSLLRETNRNIVEEKDILSDNLYHYDADMNLFQRVFFEEDFVPVTSKGGVLYA